MIDPFTIKEAADAMKEGSKAGRDVGASGIPDFSKAGGLDGVKEGKSSDIPDFCKVPKDGDWDARIPDFGKGEESDHIPPRIEQLRMTDDAGNNLRDADDNLLPNNEYEVNGTKYKTDELGRKTEWDGNLRDSPDNGRDIASQREAGGKDRLPGDDGGHLVATMNGGSESDENLVPMRENINRSDYKRDECAENKMLKEGKEVHESGKLTYEGDSSRPSKIEKTYSDGETTHVAEYDNVKGSTDLLEGAKGDISKSSSENLQKSVDDMKNAGHEVSLTSVNKEYDMDGNFISERVIIRDETSGTTDYKVYHSKGVTA